MDNISINFKLERLLRTKLNSSNIIMFEFLIKKAPGCGVFFPLTDKQLEYETALTSNQIQSSKHKLVKAGLIRKKSFGFKEKKQLHYLIIPIEIFNKTEPAKKL